MIVVHSKSYGNFAIPLKVSQGLPTTSTTAALKLEDGFVGFRGKAVPLQPRPTLDFRPGPGIPGLCLIPPSRPLTFPVLRSLSRLGEDSKLCFPVSNGLPK